MHLSQASVRSKAVVLLVLICCLVCFQLVVGVLSLSLFPVFVVHYFVSFKFCNHLEEEERESWLLCFYCLDTVCVL